MPQTSIVLKKCFLDETTVIEDNECNENGDRLKTLSFQKAKTTTDIL